MRSLGVLVIAGALLFSCRASSAWEPGAGFVGVNIFCATPSIWSFQIDSIDAGTWQAQPPESRAQFATSGPGVHVMMQWERSPANVITYVLNVRDGSVVRADCAALAAPATGRPA